MASYSEIDGVGVGCLAGADVGVGRIAGADVGVGCIAGADVGVGCIAGGGVGVGSDPQAASTTANAAAMAASAAMRSESDLVFIVCWASLSYAWNAG